MRLGVKAALVDGEFVPGDVATDGGVISGVGLTPPGRAGLAVPGFIDVQINGFDGVDFTTADTGDLSRVASALAATGVTSFQPTLISLPIADYLDALGRLDASVIQHARVLGMHLEGPFLSPERCGAHDPENMVNPDPELALSLIEAGPLSFMTVAPELTGAMDLIDLLVDHGVIVGLGHTNCDAATASEAFNRGARSVTHIFSAQRPWGHRDPGVSGVALARNDTFTTAIVDGIHLAPETVQIAARCAGDRFVLITDAISAAGQPDGQYVVGDRTVILKDGACRLEDGTLAGSSLTMDEAIRNMIGLGFSPERAIHAATAAPASLLRRKDLGVIRPGGVADICILDDSFHVRRTIVFGSESFAA